MLGLGEEALNLIHGTHANLHATNKLIPIEPLSKEQIAQIFEAAFWASLRTNEGRPTRVRLGVVLSTDTASLRLAEPLPLDEKSIVALAPAVPADGWIAVAVSDNALFIIGIEVQRSLGILSGVTSFDICGQGVVRIAFGEWDPFAVLSGRTVALTAAGPGGLWMYLAKVLQSAFPKDDHYKLQVVARRHMALVELSRMIVDEGHGGALLIVPDDDSTWETSLNPFAYKLETANTTVQEMIEASVDQLKALTLTFTTLYGSGLPEDTKKTIRAGIQSPQGNQAFISKIASLAQVDGAVVLTSDLRIRGFGAKIAVTTTEDPTVTELRPRSSEGGDEAERDEVIGLEKLGGTRHQSAARFVAAHPKTVAIVASSDRRLSIMSWDAARASVVVFRNAEWWT